MADPYLLSKAGVLDGESAFRNSERAKRDARALALHREGLSLSDIGRRLGVSKQGASDAIERALQNAGRGN